MVFSIVKDIDIDVKDVYAQYMLDSDEDNIPAFIENYLYTNDYNLNSAQFEELVNAVESCATEEEYSNIKSQARVEILKAMNDYILEIIGDDDVTDTWLAVGVPDCANEQDFLEIASNDKTWARIVNNFSRLIKEETY